MDHDDTRSTSAAGTGPFWNRAIWNKTWGDQRVLLLSLAALWAAFPWLYILLSAQIEMPAFQNVLLKVIPDDWQKLSGVPFSEVATYAGRVALAFVDPVVVLAATVWGITRGSDAVSGPLERGTMEMLLAAPVRRSAIFLTQALATTAAAALLCGVLLASVWTVVALGPWAGKVAPERFLPAVANVFGLMVCMAGISACVSAADSYRWRTIGIMCGLYVTAILTKLVGRLSGVLGWVGYLSVLNAYEPQRLVGGGPEAWRMLAWYDGILLGIGIVAYLIGAVIFSRRDLPAPL
ncbi:MAG: ABC transporter permease subunit [Pirellulales bacterium]|jgi:ABC-2 type transport system permease protein